MTNICCYYEQTSETNNKTFLCMSGSICKAVHYCCRKINQLASELLLKGWLTAHQMFMIRAKRWQSSRCVAWFGKAPEHSGTTNTLKNKWIGKPRRGFIYIEEREWESSVMLYCVVCLKLDWQMENSPVSSLTSQWVSYII